MPLSPAERQQLQADLASKGALDACTVCRHVNTMTVVDECAQIPISPTGVTPGVPAMPCVALVCNRCGSLRFHSLHAIGRADLVQRG
jgi:hypothetical protein